MDVSWVALLVGALCLLWSSKAANITHFEPTLETNHKNLVVKWSDVDKSTLILAVGEKLADKVQPSKLLLSKDTKDGFNEITLKYPESKDVLAQGLYLNGSRLIITDSQSNVICSSFDFLASKANGGILCSSVDFNPENIIFHPSLINDVLILDKSTKRLYHSSDYGNTWQAVAEQIYNVFWDDWSGKNAIYVVRREASGDDDNAFNAVKTTDFFTSSVLVQSQVHDFVMKGQFLFYSSIISVPDSSSSGASNHINVYVSKRDTEFKAIHFDGDEDLDDKKRNPIEFYVADVSGDQVFMVLSTYDKFGANEPEKKGPFFHDLYISDVTGAHMQRSLPDIGYISPMYTGINWEIIRLSNSRDKQADFYSVQGLQGVFIASQKVDGDLEEPLSVKYRTLITYNKGSIWEELVIPEDPGDKACTKSVSKALHRNFECSIQLVQASLLREGMKLLNPIYSTSSAPGMIVGTGVVGEDIGLKTFTEHDFENSNPKSNGDTSFMFLSVNGGISFSVGLKGNWIYTFLDSGGFLTAMDAFKPTEIIWYTYDHGKNWKFYRFADKPVIVYHAKTRDEGESSTLYVFCSYFDESTSSAKDDWSIIFIDFSKFFYRTCVADSDADYDFDWKVKEPGRTDLCILGKEETFVRRDPNAECMNGLGFLPNPESKFCGCTRRDYVCDVGTYYKPQTEECVHINSQLARSSFDEQCGTENNPGQVKSFSQSQGYRRVEGDECQPGSQALDEWEPKHRVCPVEPLPEFMLLTDMNNIHRLTLESGVIKSLDQVIDVGQHRYLSAMAYSYPRNELFFVDKPSSASQNNMIKRVNFSDSSLPEVIHEFDSDHVNDIAVDFLNDRLYWVEQNRKDFSHRIMSSDFDGTMKREIIGNDDLTAPKAMAIDPFKGLIFWMKWATVPAIMRATVDGRDIKEIISEDLFWSESLSIDFYTDDPKGWVYWVEAFYGRVERAHYDGSGRMTIMALPVGTTISSVTVFKDFIFAAVDTNNTVGRARKDVMSGDLVNKVTIRSDTTSVAQYNIQLYAYLSETHNVLSERCAKDNGGCSHICVEINAGTHICLCPDGMVRAPASVNSLNETCSCPDGETLDGKFCKSGSCGSGMFTCSNSVCIPERWKCDHSNDCGDNSDELGCNYEKCQDYEFECASSKKCIPKIWKCDFDYDCGEKDGTRDISDEEDCDYPECTDEQFRCNNQKCIPKEWRCDHDQDCADHSDEDHCVIKLDSSNMDDCAEQAGGFKCDQDTLCIPSQWVCDGSEDCTDKTDEAVCSDTCNAEYQFDCGSTATGERPECVYTANLCDGEDDCSNKRDESDEVCQERRVTTTLGPFYPTVDPNGQCANGDVPCPGSSQCIPPNWFCDHVADCKDRTDELDCTYAPPKPGKCPHGEFQCDSGYCIDDQWRCDGTKDCTDESDERDCEDSNATEECDGFSCYANNKHYCFDPNVVCDSYDDCPDGTDEYYCGNKSNSDTNPHSLDEVCGRHPTKDECSKDSNCFACDSQNQCIWKNRNCDQRLDCFDASDETRNCEDKPTQCKDDSFRCKTVQTECFPQQFVCDGTKHCQDKSDEDEQLCNSISFVEILETTSHTATVLWSQLPTKENVQALWIKYRFRTSLLVTTKASSSVHGRWVRDKIDDLSVVNFRVTNLEPYSTYELAVYVQYKDGSTTEAAARDVMFKTKESLPSPPQDLSVVKKSGSVSVAVVSWRPPQHPNGEVNAYQVYFSCKQTGEEQSVVYHVQSGQEGFQLTRDLNSTYTYAVRVAAINGAGTGNSSNEFNFSANSIIGPNDFPSNVRQLKPARGQSILSELTVAWNKVVLPKHKVSYRVVVTLLNDTTSDRVRVFETEALQYKITNLSPDEDYCVEVLTVVGSEHSVSSNALFFHTSGEKLPSIVDLTCSVATSPKYESVKLSWNTLDVKDSNYDVTAFSVYYGLTSTEMKAMRPLKATASKIEGQKDSKVVSGLLRGTGYLFTVRVASVGKDKRLGPLSRQLRCRTEFDPHQPPRNLKCSVEAHERSVHFSWLAPKEIALQRYTYQVMGKTGIQNQETAVWRPYGDALNNSNASVDYFIKFDNPGVSYSFIVKSNTSEGTALNDSQTVQCTIGQRGAPVVRVALMDPNTIVWYPPSGSSEPDDGYYVYGMEHANATENQMTLLGETAKGIVILTSFKYPKTVAVKFVKVAMKPYSLVGDLKGLVGQMGPRGELSLAHPVTDADATTPTTFGDLVHDRLFLKIFLPLVFVVIALFVSVVLLVMKQKRLQDNFRVAFVNSDGRGGSVTFLENPDEPGVPYGRLEANHPTAEDYDDDVMLVKT
ncbi:uncharacterized protein LOC142337650 isoform X2 [Convolutriloba macropyga]|uniref:uncharacterized protein LOC142337650 isoform X2 n=1 Tax=Convolutriloba macropyga TaxID=536237 RepID=UPI003F51DA75